MYHSIHSKHNPLITHYALATNFSLPLYSLFIISSLHFRSSHLLYISIGPIPHQQITFIMDTSLFTFDVEALIDVAVKQMDIAYIPYSKYPVGCALLTPDDQIIGGSNIENASYGLTNCAERSAVFAAASRGYRTFKAVVVATRDGGSCCGACRQVLREFIHPSQDVPIIIIKQDRTVVQITSIEGILPNSFGPENLQPPSQ